MTHEFLSQMLGVRRTTGVDSLKPLLDVGWKSGSVAAFERWGECNNCSWT
jgi:hypothetical protein